jgi:hypothetical protein
MIIHEDWQKDILNRWVQSSGHDMLTFFLYLLEPKMRRVGGIPYLVDEHDATIWSVPTANAEIAAQYLQETYTELNKELGAPVKFTGDVKIANNLAQIKCEG